MKNLFYILLSLIALISCGPSKTAKSLAGYTIDNYEVACIGVGNDGSKLFKIWGYGKTPDKAVLQAKLNAVHAAIFKGVTASSGGCQGVRAIASSYAVEQENMEYFNNFFQPGGAYLNFVALTGEGGDNREVVKIRDKTYKVGVKISVMYDALRNEMEKKGIVKGLNSGF